MRTIVCFTDWKELVRGKLIFGTVAGVFFRAVAGSFGGIGSFGVAHKDAAETSAVWALFGRAHETGCAQMNVRTAVQMIITMRLRVMIAASARRS
jgi:hypothetical protein